jgi:sulfite dehydrogenase (cytochrome) subunit A
MSSDFPPRCPLTPGLPAGVVFVDRDAVRRTGARAKAGGITINGLAWDGGYGLSAVEVSTDGGATWSTAMLGDDLGRYAFRLWSITLAVTGGKNVVTVKASNKIGQTQTPALLFNPAGYENNVMQSITLNAS